MSRPRSGLLIAYVVAAAAVVAAAGGAVFWASASHGSPRVSARPVSVAPAPAPVVSVEGLGADGLLPLGAPLVLRATNGTIQAVTGTDASSAPLTGSIGPDGSWSSTGTLIPASKYQLRAAVADAAGTTHVLSVTATTTQAKNTFTAKLIPGDGSIVGIGEPIVVRLDHKVTAPADRAAVQAALTVTATPTAQGSWRWMSDTELHYRPAQFWTAGTKIQIGAAVQGVELSDGFWGRTTVTSTFSIGDALSSVVDVTAHTMTVSQNGQVLRTLKASMGKPGFDTRAGTFLVLEKFPDFTMHSSTLHLPAGTPGYDTPVQWAVRISDSGTFTHSAPWSVRSQGVANVSHGCVNLAPADAQWFYNLAKRGDVVTVVNSPQPPLSYDPGSEDWNMTYAAWVKGSALP